MHSFKATTIAQAQNRADALRHAAKILGAEVPSHAAAQQLIAKENGFANWAALKRAQGFKVDELLLASELCHAKSSLDETGAPPRYDGESSLLLANGFSLNFDVELSGNIAHARVTDPLGREVLYFVDDEFVESPLEVMRALLVCAARLHQPCADEPVTAAKLKQICAPPGPSLSQLSAVLVDGSYFEVQCSEPDSKEPTDVVLWLSTNVDGLVTDFELCLEELQALTWDTLKGKFYAPDGTSFEFFQNTPLVSYK